MFGLLTRLLTGKNLDKRFSTLHRWFARLNRLFEKDSDEIAILPLDSKLIYNPKLVGIGFYLESFGEYEPFTTKTLLNALKPGNHFIDIGANIGYYTILGAKSVGPLGKVFAVEPESTNLAYLERNLKLNRIENATVFPGVASTSNGFFPLFLSPLGSGEHSLVIKSDHSINVQAQTIDHLIKTNKLSPNLIKIDVEGAEMDVLAGGQKTLKKYRPTIIFEYSHRQKTPSFTLEKLVRLGYGLYLIDEKDKEIIPIDEGKLQQTLEKQAFVNLLAIPRRR